MTSKLAQLRPRRQHWWWWALMGVIVVAGVVIASGSAPTEGVSDARLFSISARLKCLQCVGESVAGSQAPLAVQFREEISDRMAQGQTDDEILNYFADSYPSDVLLLPPSSGVGALVWIIPVVALAVVLLALAAAFRRWRAETPSADGIDEADEATVAAALRSRSAGPAGPESAEPADSGGPESGGPGPDASS